MAIVGERNKLVVKNLPYVDGFNIFFYTGKVAASSPGLLRAPYLFWCRQRREGHWRGIQKHWCHPRCFACKLMQLAIVCKICHMSVDCIIFHTDEEKALSSRLLWLYPIYLYSGADREMDNGIALELHYMCLQCPGWLRQRAGVIICVLCEFVMWN